jgi:hypothetical protein
LRAVRYWLLPAYGHTIKQTCEKFGISASVFRKAARELEDLASIATDEEMMLSALHGGKAIPVESLIYYYGWINRAGISPKGVAAVMDRLIAQGLVKRAGERYQLTREWP